jgi:hypothetical protein
MEHQSFNRTEPIPKDVSDYFKRQPETLSAQAIRRVYGHQETQEAAQQGKSTIQEGTPEAR